MKVSLTAVAPDKFSHMTTLSKTLSLWHSEMNVSRNLNDTFENNK